MADSDNTKKTIGLHNLDDKSRKDMFNKFVEAGGQVVSEKKKPVVADKRSAVLPSRSSGGSSSRSNANSSSDSGRYSSSNSSKSPSQSSAKSYEEELGSFSNRLAIKLKCWFARVTPFRNDEVLPSFMSEMNLAGKSALMEFNMVGNDLFGNPQFGPKITHELDKINPMYVEVIAKGHKAYDSTELYALLEPYQNAPDIPVPIYRIRDPLYSIFTKLYYIYPFQETYKKGVNLGYDILQKLENKPALIYMNKKRKFNAELTRFFGTFYEKLYLLIIRNERKNIPMVSIFMERTLGITTDLKVGNRKAGENVPEAKQENVPIADDTTDAEDAPEDDKEKEEASLSKEMKFGMSLMKGLKLSALKSKYDPRGEYNDIPDADKAFISYLFFKEFDEEYSFVMTTKKIDIKPGIVNNTKIDLRQKMVDLYETSRSSIEQMRIYHDVIVELNKHKKNPGANYIESSKKLTSLEQKRSQQSRNVRMAIREFIEKTRDNLLYLVEDMKSKQELVGNMNDILTLDMVEAKKRLNKKPIKQCIMEAYCYALVFAERLIAGDLFGGVVELSQEEMMESFGISSSGNKEKEELEELLPNEMLSEELDTDEPIL